MRALKKLLAVVAVAGFCRCAPASVYKCVDERGRTRYQAAACAGEVLRLDEAPPRPAPPPLREASPEAGQRTARSAAAKSLFKSLRPCPATGESGGPCPGYVVDHIKPLACGGADAPGNMQWQTAAEGRAKDKWERRGCGPNPAGGASARRSAAGRRVYAGPRGGRFTLGADGRKHYLGRADGG